MDEQIRENKRMKKLFNEVGFTHVEWISSEAGVDLFPAVLSYRHTGNTKQEFHTKITLK